METVLLCYNCYKLILTPRNDQSFTSLYDSYMLSYKQFRNVGNNSKTSRWFPLISSATSCNWFSAVTEREKFPISARSLWLS